MAKLTLVFHSPASRGSYLHVLLELNHDIYSRTSCFYWRQPNCSNIVRAISWIRKQGSTYCTFRCTIANMSSNRLCVTCWCCAICCFCVFCWCCIIVYAPPAILLVEPAPGTCKLVAPLPPPSPRTARPGWRGRLAPRRTGTTGTVTGMNKLNPERASPCKNSASCEDNVLPHGSFQFVVLKSGQSKPATWQNIVLHGSRNFTCEWTLTVALNHFTLLLKLLGIRKRIFMKEVQSVSSNRAKIKV